MTHAGTAGHGALTPAWRALRSAVPADGLVVSSALAHGAAEFLTDGLPHLRHVRFLPDLGPLVTDIGRPELRSDATLDTALFLGAEDRDLQAKAGAFSLGLACSPHHHTRKQRRLDALFGRRVTANGHVHALFVAESSVRVLAILQGGEGLLQACRPWIVLPLDRSPAAGRAEALLAAHRYRLFDQDLRRREAQTDAVAAVPTTWMLAVPDDGAAASPWDPSLEAALRGEGRGLAAAAQGDASTTSRTIPIDSELARWGFHAPEGDAGHGWSWIGPRPRAGLLIPATDGALMSVQLHVRASASPRNIAQAVASLDGLQAPVRHHGLDGSDALLVVSAPAGLTWQPFHRLELSFPESLRIDPYPRYLALALASITLQFSSH